ncbi:MAG: sulfite exporter TauE/SafE family protein [Pirellulales bacterium]|nr:sulfite exporter TauE/SafE family protein [Pirellulales bacterium]
MMGWIGYMFGVVSALLIGVSKTAVPGVSILGILLMTEAFPNNAKLGVGAVLPVLLVGDVMAVLRYRRYGQWDRLVRLLPFVAIGMVPGLLVLSSAEKNELRPWIGEVVLMLLLIELGRRAFYSERVPRHWWVAAVAGIAAGFSTMIAHAAFPVMTVYLMSQDLSKEKFLGTAAWFFLILNVTKLPFYAGLGMITAETLRFDMWIIPALFGGALAGYALLKWINKRLFDGLALTFAGATALYLILSSRVG